jgi:hypothetical protein
MTKTDPPDPMVLDAMLSGRESADDSGAWESLVGSPGGTRAWREAVARRRRIDRVAASLRARPWLAGPWLSARRFLRALPSSADIALGIRIESAIELQSLALPTTRTVEIVMGGEQTVAASVGQILEFVIRDGGSLHYQSSTGEKAFDGRWRLETGDAPFLVFAKRDGAMIAAVMVFEKNGEKQG